MTDQRGRRAERSGVTRVRAIVAIVAVGLVAFAAWWSWRDRVGPPAPVPAELAAMDTEVAALVRETETETPLVGLALARIGQGRLDDAAAALEEASRRRVDRPRDLERARSMLAAARRGG